jgi:hypothetical protein
MHTVHHHNDEDRFIAFFLYRIYPNIHNTSTVISYRTVTRQVPSRGDIHETMQRQPTGQCIKGHLWGNEMCGWRTQDSRQTTPADDREDNPTTPQERLGLGPLAHITARRHHTGKTRILETVLCRSCSGLWSTDRGSPPVDRRCLRFNILAGGQDSAAEGKSVASRAEP